MKILVLVFGMTASVAIEDLKFEPYFEADLPNLAVSIARDESGAMTEVVVNEWHDSVYTKEGNKNYIFQQGYDYSKKAGFIRTYTPDKELVNENYSPRYDGMVVREEMLQAFEIFKQNEAVLNLLTAVDAPITLHGGFNYEDQDPKAACYPGNRCVHVFASTPGIAVVAHAIVKLSDKSVPYPNFDTDDITRETIEKRMKIINNQRGKL